MLVGAAALGLAACSGDPEEQRQNIPRDRYDDPDAGSVFDLFRSSEQRQVVAVNSHLWAASLDVLSFLPLESSDPFSGLITTGWGQVGGDATPYRVTVLITEPALDARALKVAAFRMSGGRAVAVAAEENRRLEDAILTRARQLRIASAGR